MLDTNEQIIKLIDTSQRILVIFGTEKSDDSIAAALALKTFLEKRKKMVDIASSGFAVPRQLSFLPQVESVKPELSNLQKFTIKVDVSRAKIETLSYDVKDNWLSIYLTPKQGTISKNELRTAQSGFKYNLIIALGTQDMESLGDIYFNNTDLFFRTPIINIDFRVSNDHFGQVNLIDLSATSVSEIIFKILEKNGVGAIDEQTATILLTGMISQTRSFKTPNVNPGTLSLASKLINLGADREKIIRHLYRTKSIATLKLWGEALSNLQTDKDVGLVRTRITKNDFNKAGADESDLKDLISELISNSPEARLILVLFESTTESNKIHGLLTVEKEFDAMTTLRKFNPKGNKRSVSFVVENSSLNSAEEKAVSEIKSYVKSLPAI